MTNDGPRVPNTDGDMLRTRPQTRRAPHEEPRPHKLVLRSEALLRRVASARVLRILIPIVLLLIVAVFVFLYSKAHTGARALETALADAKAAGLPVSYDDPFFDSWRDAELNDANAATLYARAFQVMDSAPKPKDDSRLPVAGKAHLPDDPREPLPPEMLAAVGDYVRERTAALDFLHRAAAVEYCRFPIDWNSSPTDLPQLKDCRAAARLVYLAVVLAREEGRPADAAASLADGLALAKRTAEEPLLLSALVSIACHSITVDALQRFLATSNPSQDDLAALERHFEDSAAALSLRTALTGEIALSNSVFERTFGSGAPPSAGRWLFRGALLKARADHIRMLVKLVSAASNPTLDALSAKFERDLDSELVSFGGRFAVLPRQALPAYCKALRQCESVRAKLRSAAVCIAALRYKNDHGSWPNSLDALVPDYISAVPIDPFSGAPLVFTTTESGIVAYSVGPNGMDDGGKPDLLLYSEDPDAGDRTQFDDAGFRVWAPGQGASGSGTSAAPVEGLTK